MELTRAKEILTVLTEGINPVTGEVLSTNDSCNYGEVIRAFHCILNALGSQKVHTQTSNSPENAGSKWTPEEDNKIIQEYDSGLSVSNIAKEHQRTRGSIQARLIKLGKISATTPII